MTPLALANQSGLVSWFMDGIPWHIVGAIGGPVLGGLVWLGKKAWTLVEKHAERRTQGVEAIAPAIKAAFEDVRDHVTAEATSQSSAVAQAEKKIIEALQATESQILQEVGLAKRIEQIEAIVTGKAVAAPASVHERSTPAPSAPRAPSHSRPGSPVPVTP